MSSKYFFSVFAALILFIGATILVRSCRHQAKTYQQVAKPQLGGNDVEKIIVDSGRGTISTVTRVYGKVSRVSSVSKKPSQFRQSIAVQAGVRKAVIEIHKDGTVQITAPNKGTIEEFGVGVYVSDKTRIGIDMQWFYWDRWGLHFAFEEIPSLKSGRGAAGLSFNPGLALIPNTAILVTYDNTGHVGIGIRTKF